MATTEIPATMKAMVLMRHGRLDALEWQEDWPVPSFGASQVLVKVLACGLNNTDVNTRIGWYSKSVTDATNDQVNLEKNETDSTWGGRPLQFPVIQGADICGRVVAVGSHVPPDLTGKRVIADSWLRFHDGSIGYTGSERDGGFAEYCVLDYENVGVVEDCKLTDAELSTFSCSYTTAEGMLSRACVGSDDRILITGASGGVGSALVQLAKVRGATVIALSSAAKRDNVLAAGADFVLDRSPKHLNESLKETTGNDNVSVIADVVGGDYFPHLINALDRKGRYVTAGAIGGPMVQLDLRTLYLKDLTLFGSTVVPKSVFPHVVACIQEGKVKPMLAATYDLKDLHKAQEAFMEKKHTGNIVVVP